MAHRRPQLVQPGGLRIRPGLSLWPRRFLTVWPLADRLIFGLQLLLQNRDWAVTGQTPPKGLAKDKRGTYGKVGPRCSAMPALPLPLLVLLEAGAVVTVDRGVQGQVSSLPLTWGATSRRSLWSRAALACNGLEPALGSWPETGLAQNGKSTRSQPSDQWSVTRALALWLCRKEFP